MIFIHLFQLLFVWSNSIFFSFFLIEKSNQLLNHQTIIIHCLDGKIRLQMGFDFIDHTFIDFFFLRINKPEIRLLIFISLSLLFIYLLNGLLIKASSLIKVPFPSSNIISIFTHQHKTGKCCSIRKKHHH